MVSTLTLLIRTRALRFAVITASLVLALPAVVEAACGDYLHTIPTILSGASRSQALAGKQAAEPAGATRQLPGGCQGPSCQRQPQQTLPLVPPSVQLEQSRHSALSAVALNLVLRNSGRRWAEPESLELPSARPSRLERPPRG